MAGPRLPLQDLDKWIAILLAPVRAGQSSIAERDFDKISALLLEAGKPEWSVRPRTFAVMYLIHRVHMLDAFVLIGCKDINLPYTEERLPRALDTITKAHFLEKQHLALTKAADLESSGGRHRHFANDADLHFQFIKRLGSGSSGEVDHVRSKLSLEEYAIKRTRRRMVLTRDKQAVGTFENELNALKRLSHKHLVRLIGSYTDPNYIGLIISPVADTDLKTFLERQPFPQQDFHLTRDFFGCLASALSYLHDAHCRHKDLKPGNVLIKDGKVLITDFGTARDWSDRERSTTVGLPGRYTAAYAAPEVIDQGPRNSSADIWSLGCIFLDMTMVLKGKTKENRASFFEENGTCRPLPGTNPEALAFYLDSLLGIRDNRPLSWIRQMTKKNPKGRITAAALLEGIRQLRSEAIYCGLCCRDDEDTDDSISYTGSDFEEYVPIKASISSISSPQSGGQKRHRSQTDRPALETEHKIHKSDLYVDDTLGIIPSTVADEVSSRHRDTVPKRLPLEKIRPAREGQTRIGHEVDILNYRSALNTEKTFINAVVRGDEKKVRLLIQRGADINICNNHKRTAIHVAAQFGHEAITRLLIDLGASVNATDETETTALHWSALYGHEKVVRLLLEKGAAIEASNEYGNTALQLSAFHGYEAVVRLLLEKGAAVDASNKDGSTALHLSASCGHEAVMRLLLEKGAAIDTSDKDGNTALYLSASCGREAVVRLLLEKGADFNNYDGNCTVALDAAKYNGTEEIKQLHIETGIRVDSAILETSTSEQEIMNT